jgi:hypothetical protein
MQKRLEIQAANLRPFFFAGERLTLRALLSFTYKDNEECGGCGGNQSGS